MRLGALSWRRIVTGAMLAAFAVWAALHPLAWS